VKGVAGDFACPIDPWRGMQMVAERYPPTADEYDPALDALLDRIVREQQALGH